MERLLQFTFSPELITQPLLWRLVETHHLVVNIRLADVDGDYGWVQALVSGEPEKVAEGLAWIEAKGVKVDELPLPTPKSASD